MDECLQRPGCCWDTFNEDTNQPSDVWCFRADCNYILSLVFNAQVLHEMTLTMYNTFAFDESMTFDYFPHIFQEWPSPICHVVFQIFYHHYIFAIEYYNGGVFESSIKSSGHLVLK